jgi:hypothetical protein
LCLDQLDPLLLYLFLEILELLLDTLTIDRQSRRYSLCFDRDAHETREYVEKRVRGKIGKGV